MRVQPGSSLGTVVTVHSWGAALTSPDDGFPRGPKRFKGTPGKGGNVLELDDLEGPSPPKPLCDFRDSLI